MNPSTPSTVELAAFVALDWADRKHAWASQAAGQARAEYGELENTPEAIEVWASQLEQRFGGRAIAVALEQPRGCGGGRPQQIRPSGAVSGPPQHLGPLPPELLPFRRQERPQ